VKVDKKAKRKKRQENEGNFEQESGSEAEESEEAAEDEDGEVGGKKQKEKKDPKHAPLKKTKEEIKAATFLGEKYGHFKCGTYLRIELKVDKQISRKLEPEYPVVLCSLKH